MPVRLTRPTVGRMPTRLLIDDGARTLPPDVVAVCILVPIVGQSRRLVAVLQNYEGAFFSWNITNGNPTGPYVFRTSTHINNVGMDTSSLTGPDKSWPNEIKTSNGPAEKRFIE